MQNIILKEASSEKEKRAVYSLRYNIYVEKLGWLNDNYPDRMEYDEHDLKGLSPSYIVAIKTEKRGLLAIGTVRAIYESDLPLPIFQEFNECSFPAKFNYCEVSRLIVSNPHGLNTHDKAKLPSRHSIPLSLIRLLYQGSINQGISNWYASFDISSLNLIKAMGFPFKEIGKGKYFMGSISIPCILTHEDLEQFGHPLIWRYINTNFNHDPIEAIENASRVVARIFGIY